MWILELTRVFLVGHGETAASDVVEVEAGVVVGELGQAFYKAIGVL